MQKLQPAIAEAHAPRGLLSAPPMPGSAHRDGSGQPAGANEPDATKADRVAAAWADLPPLETRPQLWEANRLVAMRGGGGAADFDMLRTRLMRHLRAKGWRRVAITSPGPGCGTSLVCLNLGFSLGRQAETRSLVCDLDLRHPALARRLGCLAQDGFARVLRGEGRFENNALRFGANLAFATTPDPVADPAELLQGTRAAEEIERIERRYDPAVMLFDLPPMQRGDEAMAFMERVDAVLLVAACDRTTYQEIDRCERELAGLTNVLGVVLNACRHMA
ncbi:CpsD/CapB family tyrosine-protein kinase [Limimaricola sp.]|uniref:CpsD/CapB family tyrosine-protein kinase n=1 Tax=Limimaricola sp. TaxID=2211665 RepID=UPI004058EFE1